MREFPEILPVDQKNEEKATELSWDHAKTNPANCFPRMHCPAVPEEKSHYKKSYGLSDSQTKAGSDFSNLDSEKHRKGPLKTELFPGSNATFRILEVLYCKSKDGRWQIILKCIFHATLLMSHIF